MAADLHRRRILRDDSFRLLVDAVEDYAIFILDVDGVIQSWNRGAQRIKGYTESEAVGRHFSMLTGAIEPSGHKQRPDARMMGVRLHTSFRSPSLVGALA